MARDLALRPLLERRYERRPEKTLVSVRACRTAGNDRAVGRGLVAVRKVARDRRSPNASASLAKPRGADGTVLLRDAGDIHATADGIRDIHARTRLVIGHRRPVDRRPRCAAACSSGPRCRPTNSLFRHYRETEAAAKKSDRMNRTYRINDHQGILSILFILSKKHRRCATQTTPPAGALRRCGGGGFRGRG